MARAECEERLMGNSNYARGAGWERRIKEELEGFGAMAVIRAAGSHGKVDLAACFVAGTVLLQVKSGRAKPNRTEWEALRRLGRALSGRCLVGALIVGRGVRRLQVVAGGVPEGLMPVLRRMEDGGWELPEGLTSSP